MYKEGMFSFFWIRQCSPDNYPELKYNEVHLSFMSSNTISHAGKVYKITGNVHYMNIKNEQRLWEGI